MRLQYPFSYAKSAAREGARCYGIVVVVHRVSGGAVGCAGAMVAGPPQRPFGTEVPTLPRLLNARAGDSQSQMAPKRDLAAIS